MSFATTTPDNASPARPRRPRKRWRVRAASLIIGAGLVMLAVGLGYLVYAELARSRLGELVYDVSPIERAAWVTAPPPEANVQPSTSPDAPDDVFIAGVAGEAQLFPARWTNPKYWAEPEWAGSAPYGGADLPDGFVYVNPADLNAGRLFKAAAETLKIPAIGLTTGVYDLTLHTEGDRLVWESPVDIVGHIPGTALPGQTGAGWYFGHLESPVRGEGNVFHDLPDVVDLVKNDPVDIIIGSADGEFLYRVTGTDFVHRDDLVLAETSESTVTLAASYPKLVYDHRLLVTGELLAFRPPE
ncbi:MAG: sortase [Chloroflexi bacterium]|nr:sortase [Chloroflexota bacterium]